MNKSKQHLPLFTMQVEFPLPLLQMEIELTRSSSTCLKPSPVSLGRRHDGLFLLYDFVHLIKNIRNNWLTETIGELNFEHEGKIYTAKWSHLVKLYQLELMANRTTNGIRGLSSLNVAVRPKPVERQNVSTYLRIFSDETLHALKVHPGLDQQEVEGTITFVQKVNTMWKILNVRSRNKDVIRNACLLACLRLSVASDDDDSLCKVSSQAVDEFFGGCGARS